MHDLTPRRVRRLLAVALAAVVLGTTVAGCGSGEEPHRSTASALGTPFRLEPAERGQTVTGHGVSLVVPAGWTASSDEQLDPQGRTFEWAVQAPAAADAVGTDFPPFVNMSMGVPGKTSTGYDAAPEALKTVEGVNQDFKVLDEGDLDVPGVDKAYQVRFQRAAQFQGRSVLVEQVQVFLDMPDGVLSTLRFQAPAGAFEESGLPDVLDSLTVTAES